MAADLFRAGQKAVSVSLGSGSIDFGGLEGREHYTIIGVGGTYFPVDNLSVGLEYRYWSGEPDVNEVTVPVTYYLPTSSAYRPYGGAFYRHYAIGGGYEDFSAYGARAGVAVVLSKNSYLAVGWVEEKRSNCSQFDECRSGYAEALIGVSF
jgi:opacity protein-like surface antigen